MFRLGLVGVALVAVLAFIRPGADETVGPGAPVAAPPQEPLAKPALPATEAEAKKAYEAAKKKAQEEGSPSTPSPSAASESPTQRLTLRYEQETAPESLRPPPLPDRSPVRDKQRFYRIVVESAGTLKAEDTVIRLSGLSAPKPDDTCPAARGAPWPCGRMGQAALARLIRSRAIECRFDGRDADGALLGRCTVAGVDINDWVVRMGWARTEEGSAYAQALEAAKQTGSGLWSKGNAQP